MSHQSIGGDFTLTTDQILLATGAINAGIEFAARFGDPITPEFDSTRLPHLESARAVLSNAADQLAPQGEFTGRMTPSEMRATRMAIGFVESQLTPPGGAVLSELSINPTDRELAALGTVLDGLTPASDEDVAFDDWRRGVNTNAIGDVVPLFPNLLDDIRNAADRPQPLQPPTERAEQARQIHQTDVRDCQQAGVAIGELAIATAAAGGPRSAVIPIGSDLVDSITGMDCFYSEFHRTSLRAAWGNVQQAAEVGDQIDQTLSAMDLATAWFWNRARREATTI